MNEILIPYLDILYHFIQLVSIVMGDRLDEILFSSFGFYSHDMQKFWEESDHKYIIFLPIRPLEKKEKKIDFQNHFVIFLATA